MVAAGIARAVAPIAVRSVRNSVTARAPQRVGRPQSRAIAASRNVRTVAKASLYDFSSTTLGSGTRDAPVDG